MLDNLKVMRNIKQSGFTLIELLIVIGVLGILAAGLLAAVDPFEQLKKGRDSNVRNQVVELHNANIRYYATHGDLPWNDASCTFAAISTSPQTLAAADAAGCITPLINDGELKPDFTAAVGAAAANIYMYSPTQVSLTICFSPGSKSVYADDATRYSNDGTDLSASTCTTANKQGANGPGTDSCFWCAK